MSVTAVGKGLKPLARIVAFGSHSHDPWWFTTAPVQATRSALQQAGWSIADVDLWEVNEAFTVVPLAFMAELNVPHNKLKTCMAVPSRSAIPSGPAGHASW